MAELSSCSKDHIALKPRIFTLWLLPEKSLLTLALDYTKEELCDI